MADQDEKCFACGRKFRGGTLGPVYHPRAITIDGQQVLVGHDCAKKIAESMADGYQPPLGGPRLWIDLYAPQEALAAAGITIKVGYR
jgi:hypothetical protein